MNVVAAVLHDGRVLVAGGGLRSAELFNPDTRTLVQTGTMAATPVEGTAIATMPDGRIFVPAIGDTGGRYAKMSGSPPTTWQLGPAFGNPGTERRRRKEESRTRRFRITAAVLVSATVALLLFRVTLGVDFGDESYYANFIQDWLNEGAGQGDQLIIHQTAAFLVFPFALFYTAVAGDTVGLVLTLRVLYLVMAAAASIAVYGYVAGTRSRAAALMTSLFVFTFIPWSLPAPSYNTIGMFAFLAGAVLVGRYLDMSRARSPVRPIVLWSAGLCFVMAVVAYPTLVVAVVPLVLLLAVRRDKRMVRHLLGSFICAGMLGALATVGFFGIQKLVQVFAYTLAVLGSGASAPSKIGNVGKVLIDHPAFVLLCAAAMLVGFMVATRRRRAGSVEISLYLVLMSLVLLISSMTPTALYLRTHDQIMLVAIFGLFPIGLLPDDNREGNPPRQHVIRLVYFGAIFAGAVTSWSATNGLWNFHVGGLAAAVATFAFVIPADTLERDKWVRLSSLGLVGLAVLVNIWACFAYVYGEASPPSLSSGVRVEGGPYAWLLTSPSNAAFIEEASSALARDCPARGRILVVWLPGGYLLSGMTAATQSTAAYATGPSPLADQVASYYADASHLPDCIVTYGGWVPGPPTPAESDLISNYHLVDTIKGPDGASDFVVRRRP